MRIIVVSHSHPDITKGGAENAAIAHFHALKAQGHDCLFVALTPHGNIGHDGRFGAFRGREDELLWVGAEFDDFRLTARNFHQVMKDMDEMIGDFKPDLIHFHHYFGIGLDVIQEIKESKGIKVFLTLHEYGGICHHYGQMIKTSKELCYASSPSECAKCFPGTASGFFFLRRERILRALNSLDGIVSPSAFLAKRYAEFGVDAHRLHVVENLVSVRYGAAPEAKAPVVAYSEDRPLVLGYFGQFTPFKGVDVVLKAMKLLPETTLEKIRVVLYGTAHGQANQEFFAAQAETIENLFPTVTLNGGYKSEDVVGLMRDCDWIVMPSVWWENAPVVLQEARLSGVPALVSNVGGMAEKVGKGVHGEHFVVANPGSLASRLNAIINGDIQVTVPEFDLDAYNRGIMDNLTGIYGATA